MMDALRDAIIEILQEDIDVIGEPTGATLRLVEAWNALPDEVPIPIDQFI